MVRVADLRANFLCRIHEEGLIDHAESVAAECENLDTALETWSRNVPVNWRPATVPATKPPLMNATSQENMPGAHSYPSTAHAALWNQYRCLRLVVNNIILNLFQTTFLSPSHFSTAETYRARCFERIRMLSEDLCSGVMFVSNSQHLCRKGGHNLREGTLHPKMAWLLVWPLTMAVSTECIPEPQSILLRTKMQSVTELLGDITFNLPIGSVKTSRASK